MKSSRPREQSCRLFEARQKDTRRPKAADRHTENARRPQLLIAVTGADTGSDSSACLVGKAKKKTERFAREFPREHDMEAENGLTGWGDLDG